MQSVASHICIDFVIQMGQYVDDSQRLCPTSKPVYQVFDSTTLADVFKITLLLLSDKGTLRSDVSFLGS